MDYRRASTCARQLIMEGLAAQIGSEINIADRENGLHAVVYIEFAQNRRYMRFNSGFSNIQVVSNLLISKTAVNPRPKGRGYKAGRKALYSIAV